ncbi:MAG: hypothetical protein KGI51_08385, partial [Rhodospirillales bacterium]|nr:hypothetical protein [Rhodospirillales bacterium]
LPFFFLAGLFVGLCFVLRPDRVGAVYAADLAGAGAAAAALMAAMYLLDPFRLVSALLPALAAAALFAPQGRWRRAGRALAVLGLIAAEALLFLGPQAAVSQYKPIYAPAHTPGARVLARVFRPSGAYVLMDDFTERLDTDLSDDAAMLHVPGPPRTLGLYRDGGRIAALPRAAAGWRVAYAPATLGALPYRLLTAPRVLLVGAGGGYRIAAARALGAGSVTALEPEPVLFAALRHGLGPAPSWESVPSVTLSPVSPLAALRAPGALSPARFDLIDIAADFLAAAPDDEAAFTAEALAADLALLRPGGMISVPVSIRDFPVYALRVLATARRALALAGIADAGAHVIAYRSAWTVRVLISPQPFDAARIARARAFCDRRSFDLSWYPGIDVAAARGSIYNDLPPVSFAAGTVRAGGPDDAIADEAGAVLAGQAAPSATSFSLRPMTLDRPFFYAALRLSDLRTLLRRLEVLPQPEIAALVNLAVLAQALAIALAVLIVPLIAPRLRRAEAGEPVTWGSLTRVGLFFPALGLGYLFIEITLIAEASLALGDRASAFALVLSLMLIASGAGALLSGRLAGRDRLALALAACGIAAWVLAALAGLRPTLLAAIAWPYAARVALLAVAILPIGFVLGLPFPLGLARLAGRGRLLPWAWGLNGAFSVLATPLAALIAREAGYSRVLFAALLLYGVAALSFPRFRSVPAWRLASPSRPGAR